jgi:excisionase family DNA binding protein
MKRKAADTPPEAQSPQLTLPVDSGRPPEHEAEVRVLARIESAKKIIRIHPEVSFEEAMLQLNPLPRAAYTLKECARVLGISYISVYRLVERGKLKCSTALPGRKLIPTREVEAFLKR